MNKKFNLKQSKRRVKSNQSKKIEIQLSCHEAGKKLKEQREKFGLSRNELAIATRIATNVIEAIEEGWTTKFPESAYLGAMLTQLEVQLELKKGTLDGALQRNNTEPKRKTLPSYTSWNIDIFSSWQGSLIYSLIMVGTIGILNYQQRKIANQNTITLNPIKPNHEYLNVTDQLSSEIQSPSIEGLEPKTEKGKAHIFSFIFKRLTLIRKDGWLEIKLNKFNRLSIESHNGYKTNIDNANGSIRLEMSPPILIKAEPALTNLDLVIWREKPYLIKPNNKGIYRINN